MKALIAASVAGQRRAYGRKRRLPDQLMNSSVGCVRNIFTCGPPVRDSRTQLRPRRVGSWRTMFALASRCGPSMKRDVRNRNIFGTFAWRQASHGRKQLSYRCNEPGHSCSISGTGNRSSSMARIAGQGYPEFQGDPRIQTAIRARSPATSAGLRLFEGRENRPSAGGVSG